MINPELTDLITRVAKAQAAANEAFDSAQEAKHYHDLAVEHRDDSTQKLRSLQIELDKALGARY